jgi:two-component system cell cycle response regulator
MKDTEKVDILIVDDNPDNLSPIERLLASPGLNIVQATSGLEAVALTGEYDFALILMDVRMPDMDGFETAARIHMNPDTTEIPIIFVTAIGKEQKDIYKGYQSGAVDYLFKPFNPHILKSKVNVFLELYRRRRALRESHEALKKSQEQLVELERKHSIMAMAVTANHELNQPLTVLGGYLKMLEDTLPPDTLSDKQKKYIRKIKESVERINGILRKFNKVASIKIENYTMDRNKKMVIFD